ncbi:MAG: hypothetical protein ACRDKZ_10720 [Actinomycetota bacterium]
MEQARLPDWESDLVDEAIRRAQARLEDERHRAHRRALQLAREQAYHRLAVAIDRPPSGRSRGGQLSFWPSEPSLFDIQPED